MRGRGGGHGGHRGRERQRAPQRWVIVSLAFVAVMVFASAAHAELAFFATGRSLSIKGHRFDGDSLVLALRGGGEIVCDRSVVTRIAPDEVPYPEPAAVPPPSALQPPPEYARLVASVAGAQGVDVRLVHALIQVESGYRPGARSPKGAMGLMQLMPETVREYAVADPYEPAENVTAGVKHLKALLGRFPTVALALAAYNAGEAAVRQYGGIPPYAETRSYVARILKLVGGARR